MADPVGGKIYSAAVPAEFDSFFNHLFTVNLELYLVLMASEEPSLTPLFSFVVIFLLSLFMDFL